MSQHLTQYAVVFTEKKKLCPVVNQKIKRNGQKKLYIFTFGGGGGSILIYITFLQHYPENGPE